MRYLAAIMPPPPLREFEKLCMEPQRTAVKLAFFLPFLWKGRLLIFWLYLLVVLPGGGQVWSVVPRLLIPILDNYIINLSQNLQMWNWRQTKCIVIYRITPTDQSLFYIKESSSQTPPLLLPEPDPILRCARVHRLLPLSLCSLDRLIAEEAIDFHCCQ